jgi:ketosteroid isomerase-like protein
MSAENLEVVRRMYEAFNRGDAEAALQCFDPDVVMDASHRVDGRVGHGRDEMTAILAEWLGTWDDFRDEVEEMHDLGERILVISTQTGRGKGSGVNWEGRFGMLFELRGGQIVQWTVYDDPDAAAKAAGLSD